MSGIVAVTAFAGFVASWALLEFAAMHDMALRYPCAVAIAYAVFVALLWVWLHVRGDVPAEFGGGGTTDNGDNGWDCGSGRSGGGGASASWQSTSSPPSPSTVAGDGPLDSISDIGMSDIDEPEGCVVIVALAVIGIVVVGGVYLVWIAPGLLAEIMLDAALAGGLYRRLRRIERQHWLQTALQRTAGPFLVTAIVLGVLGFAAQRAKPGIDSINDVIGANSHAPSRNAWSSHG